MSRYISEHLRDIVAKRAEFRCEYCRVYARHSFLTFHVEHIVSIKHGGKTIVENLAYSCPICNLNKGSDIATFLEDMNTPVRFFNPRVDIWNEHFGIDDSGLLLSKSPIGASTIKILDFNHPDSIIERRELLLKGMF